MGGPPVDHDEFDRWRAEADAALRGARLQAEGGLHNWACFAAEQAAQLAVKDYIPARYPDAHPSGPPGMHYAGSDSSEALADAGRVLSLVDGLWETLSR
jgi:HEPN domain-containing protein